MSLSSYKARLSTDIYYILMLKSKSYGIKMDEPLAKFLKKKKKPKKTAIENKALL